jgi:hypothetical protein
MILFNTTCSVAHEVADNFVNWYHEQLKEAIRSLKYVSDVRLLILRQEADQDTGTTFALQVLLVSRGALHTYLQKDVATHEKMRRDRFGNQLVEFSTILEEV